MAEIKTKARAAGAQDRPATRLADIGHRIAVMPRPSQVAVRMIEDSFIDILGCVLSGNRSPEAAALLAAKLVSIAPFMAVVMRCSPCVAPRSFSWI